MLRPLHLGGLGRHRETMTLPHGTQARRFQKMRHRKKVFEEVRTDLNKWRGSQYQGNNGYGHSLKGRRTFRRRGKHPEAQGETIDQVRNSTMLCFHPALTDTVRKGCWD
jgi:hypothetical protein